MTGREFVQELERRGFVVKRRSKSFVWIARGEQTLLLDEEAQVPESFLRVLGLRSLAPVSGGRRSSTPTSVRRPASGTRTSKPPGRSRA